MLPSTVAYMYFVPCLLVTICICIGSDCVGHNRSAVYNCKGFIAIITNNYLKSDTCIEKLHMACSSKKKIFPVTREDVDYTQSEKALGVKSVIQNINWVYFRQDLANYSQSLAHLVSRVTASGKQCVASTEVHLKLPLLLPLVFFLWFNLFFVHTCIWLTCMCPF